MGCVTDATDEPIVEEIDPMQLLWSTESFEYVGIGIESSPYLIGDSTVLMSAGGNLRLHNQQTGDLIWETFISSGTNIQTEIFAVDEDRIYAPHVSEVRSWDLHTGELVWSTEFPNDRGAMGGELVLDNEKLYVAGWHHVHCLDPISGGLLWSSLLGDSTAVNDLVLYEGKLYAGTGGFVPKGVFVLDPSTGDSLDIFTINSGRGKILNAPVFDGSIMFVGTSWRSPMAIEAWNIDSHAKVWSTGYPGGGMSFINHSMIIDDLVIFSMPPFEIGAWNRETGAEEWLISPTGAGGWSRIGYDGSWLYYEHGYNIQVIEPQTGSIVHVLKSGAEHSFDKLTVTNDKIFVHGTRRNMCYSTYRP